MNIQAKLIVFMAAMLLLLLVVTGGIGTWVINTIIYGLNTELLSLKLAARIEEIERAITIIENSGATGIAKYVRQAQTEILQQFQEHIAAQTERYYIITGKDRQSLLQTKTGQNVNISADVLKRMFATKSGTTKFIYEEVSYFTVYRYFDKWDWLIGVSLPQTTMFQQRQVYFRTVSFFSLIVFIGVLVLAYVIGKRLIVNPIAMLVTVTKAIATGHFDQTLQFRQRDEIGQLADAIHTMAQQLRQNFEQITAQLATIQQDMAERKRAEVEREKLIVELEAKNAELERFTYTVSHDLKSPLVTVSGFLGFLEQDATKGDMERLRGDMQHIRKATDTMQQLLNELLELSRIGRLINPSQTVAFEDIVQEALARVAGQITKRGVQIIIAADFPRVSGDRPRLIEVIQNLVENAIKFMGEQPEPQIDIGVQYQDQETMFFVADNGIGIDPRYHEKIFGLFERLDPTLDGTGIGLALVKRIIEVHDGRIWVASAGQGQGSTFYFTLPQAQGGRNEL
jgi:signal transduction histidine kinase